MYTFDDAAMLPLFCKQVDSRRLEFVAELAAGTGTSRTVARESAGCVASADTNLPLFCEHLTRAHQFVLLHEETADEETAEHRTGDCVQIGLWARAAAEPSECWGYDHEHRGA